MVCAKEKGSSNRYLREEEKIYNWKNASNKITRKEAV